MLVPLPIVPAGIGSQIANNVVDPELKPGVHSHLIGNEQIILGERCLFCLLQPVPGFREGREVLVVSLSQFIYISCGVETILSLADTLTAFFAF